MSYNPSVLDIGIGVLNSSVFDNVDTQIASPVDEVDQTEIQEGNAVAVNDRKFNNNPFFYSQGNYECYEERRSKSSNEVNCPYFSTQGDNITNIVPKFNTKSKKVSPSKKQQNLLTSSANSYIVQKHNSRQGRLLIKIDVHELDDVDKNNEACLSVQYVVQETYDDVMDITETLIKKICNKFDLSSTLYK